MVSVLVSILIIGFFSGLVSVFLGLGGGMVLVPLLMELFSLTLVQSVALSVFITFLVTSTNSYKFHRQGLVDWHIVGWVGPVTALSSLGGAWISPSVGESWMTWVLVFVLFFIFIKTLFFLFFHPHLLDEKRQRDWKFYFGLMAGGSLAGWVCGMAGMGAGVILSSLLILLKAVGPKQLSPTANANLALASGGATWAYLQQDMGPYPLSNSLYWFLIFGIYVCAFFFTALFRPHQSRLPQKWKLLFLSLWIFMAMVKLVTSGKSLL